MKTLIFLSLFLLAWLLSGIAFTALDPAPANVTALDNKVKALEARVNTLENWATKRGGRF